MFFFVVIGIAVILLALIVTTNNRRFDQRVTREIEGIFKDAVPQPERIFAYDDLEGLPQPVQNYLKRCVREGQPYIRCARLKQTGMLRLSPEQSWKPFTAQQYFTNNPPAFVWRVGVDFMPLMKVVGQDKYVRQHGHMLIKVLSTIAVVNEHGPKIAVGAFIRYIAELMWMPTAMIDNPHIRWESIDACTARAWVCDGDVKGELTFRFDAHGDIVQLVSDSRYADVNDEKPTRWYVNVKGYREFDGVRIPAEAELVWERKTGLFDWWRGTVNEIEFNTPMVYL